jgi:hypothetical protein
MDFFGIILFLCYEMSGLPHARPQRLPKSFTTGVYY